MEETLRLLYSLSWTEKRATNDKGKIVTNTTRLRAFMIACSLCLVSTTSMAQTCKNGAVYEVSTGFLIVVTRMGTGEVDFARSGVAQSAVALDFFLPHTGDRGFIYGPQRSYMFATDLETLEANGFSWGPAPKDTGGFFRVLTDDGTNEIFHFEFQKCFS